MHGTLAAGGFALAPAATVEPLLGILQQSLAMGTKPGPMLGAVVMLAIEPQHDLHHPLLLGVGACPHPRLAIARR